MSIFQEQEDKKVYLFSYGSMKKGFKNAFRLDGRPFVCEAVSAEKYKMYPGKNYFFPYAIEEEGEAHIKGELYEVSSLLLDTVIDVYEGVDGGHYERKLIKVISADSGLEYSANAYFMGPTIMKNDYDLNFPISDWTKELEDCGDKMSKYVLGK